MHVRGTGAAQNQLGGKVMSKRQAIVIGGGVLGVSVLFHLARNGWRDVLLIEKSALTSGSTWHASGDIGFSVASELNLWFTRYSLSLYMSLDGQGSSGLSWQPTGGLRIAYGDREVTLFEHYVARAREIGLNFSVVSAQELLRLHPLFDVEGVRAGLYSREDGNIDPYGVTIVMADAAKRLGARILCRNRAVDASRTGRGYWAVRACDGTVFTCDHLIIAGGSYTRQIGEWFGARLPVYSFLHHYFVTAELPVVVRLSNQLPIVRDERCGGYVRQEQKGLLIGTTENEVANVVWERGVPWDADHELFEPDYESISHLLARAICKLPVLADARLKTAVRGAVTYTPDGGMLLGRVARHENLWVAGGASNGIAWGGGAGRCLADLIVHGRAPVSIASLDPNRFSGTSDDELLARAKALFLRRGSTGVSAPSEIR